MRIHHLNCISSCPLGGHLMDARTPGIARRGRLACHCLLLEDNDGLTLVDTGFGLRDVAQPRTRLSGFFLALLSPEFREHMTAIRQIERLGFSPADVHDILLTHLDFDHAGGLDDFPHARVHMLADERDRAVQQKTWMDRQRYRPQQWSHPGNWIVHGRQTGGERWHGFDCVRGLAGFGDEVLLVPLPGHTFGHAGVAIRSGGRWLLHAGDAYFHEREMDHLNPWCPPGLRMYQTMLEMDRGARLGNQQRLRQLRHEKGSEVDVFSAHDVAEFERLSGRSAELAFDAGLRAADAAP